MKKIYDRINVPEKCGCYYIFKNPKYFTLDSNEQIIVPLGIKAEIIEEEYILSVNRYNIPGKPYKKINITPWYTVPFIPSDYDGPICILIENKESNRIIFDEGEAIACGVFLPVGYAF